MTDTPRADRGPSKTTVIRALAATRAIQKADTATEMLHAALDAALELADADAATIVVPDGHGTFKIRAARRADGAPPPAGTAPAAYAELLRKSLADRTMLATGSLDALPRSSRVKSVLVAPLAARGSPQGVLILEDERRPRRFGPKDDALLALVTALVGLALASAIETAALASQLEKTRALVPPPRRYPRLLGDSPPMQALHQTLERVAASDATVLVLGESGTGKELVARTIHEEGPRRAAPFVALNVTAIPETLLETEIFGHEAGAFTGAKEARPGVFRQADGGTLFLDEVGDMAPALQVRLLRVLQEGVVRPVGSTGTHPVDVRVVAATHRDLEALVREGKFREDLYYRLHVVTVATPPLRERTGDLPTLAAHFLRLAIEKDGRRTPPRLGRDALRALESYPWPGNVRELENELRRAVVLGSDPIRLVDLSPRVADARADEEVVKGYKKVTSAMARAALARTGGNVSKAARLLGLSRASFYRKAKDWRLM